VGQDDFEIIPFSFLGNPRAKKLLKKDVLAEFGWYAQSASALKKYVQALQVALSRAGKPWPDRPQMPTLQPRPAHKEQRPQRAAK
jgi:hypothetical protein